jgi:hypothetical protein
LHEKVKQALEILVALDMPRAQRNERSAMCLLAIAGVVPDSAWSDAVAQPFGITPIMEFAARHYRKRYAPNTRETIRRQSMHQFCDAGIAVYNPDNPGRAVNSPHAVYQISPEALALVQTFGTGQWLDALRLFRAQSQSLAKRYSSTRELSLVPLKVADGKDVKLSPGEHSELLRQIVEVFGAHYAPGGTLLYVGDTGAKWAYSSRQAIKDLGVTVDEHGKMPDVVIHHSERNWIFLCEAVTSHGPVDNKRYGELKHLFRDCTAGLVFVTAFPNRAIMTRYLPEIAWETEVWCADHPTHLIHFNGTRFLGPHEDVGKAIRA